MNEFGFLQHNFSVARAFVIFLVSNCGTMENYMKQEQQMVGALQLDIKNLECITCLKTILTNLI